MLVEGSADEASKMERRGIDELRLAVAVYDLGAVLEHVSIRVPSKSLLLLLSDGSLPSITSPNSARV